MNENTFNGHGKNGLDFNLNMEFEKASSFGCSHKIMADFKLCFTQ